MPKVVAKLREEVRKVFLTAVFFSIGFGIIIVHNRLLTTGSGIQVPSFTRAVVGGLIVAKLLLSVDLLPFVHAFPRKPLVHNIAWKTSLYIAASVIFFYVRPLVEGLFKRMGLASSHIRAWNELLHPRTWATLIWVAVLLLAFVTMQELSRVIGKDQMRRIFFGRKGNPPTETTLRDAA